MQGTGYLNIGIPVSQKHLIIPRRSRFACGREGGADLGRDSKGASRGGKPNIAIVGDTGPAEHVHRQSLQGRRRVFVVATDLVDVVDRSSLYHAERKHRAGIGVTAVARSYK